jgi:hypothetical protein
MPRRFYGATLSVVAAAVAGAFVWYTDRPSSYDECVVSEMRGQSPQIMYVIQKVCAVRFHKMSYRFRIRPPGGSISGSMHEKLRLIWQDLISPAEIAVEKRTASFPICDFCSDPKSSTHPIVVY